MNVNNIGKFENIVTADEEGSKKELYRFKISDSRLNRNGWRIMTEGMKLSEYMQNPVVLFSHDPSRIIGVAKNVYKENDSIYADVWFHEENEDSRMVKKLLDVGVLKMTSVGVAPISNYEERIPPNYQGSFPPYQSKVIVYDKSELRELSVVPIPANTGAALKERIAASDISSEMNNILINSFADYMLFNGIKDNEADNYYLNDFITNEGESAMTEQEIATLKNSVETAVHAKEELQNSYNELQTKYNDAIAENATVLAEVASAKEALENATKSLAEANAKIVEAEIDNFLALNNGKILPAEKNDLKAELLLFKNNSDMKIGEVSLYDKKCEEIKSRPAHSLEKEFVSTETKTNSDKSEFDFETSDGAELEKIHLAVKKLMVENNIGYSEAYDKLRNKY